MKVTNMIQLSLLKIHKKKRDKERYAGSRNNRTSKILKMYKNVMNLIS